jgi:hypothetical protein
MSKNRSPNYPSVPLKDAIADIEAVFKKDMRNKMSADTVVKHLGYTSLNGRSLKKVATLKAYGLLDGRGDELRVTEDAIEIIAEAANSPKWQEKVKAAVFKPKVFEDINTHYEGARPSAEGLHSFLLKAGFTFEAIDTIIKVYMANFDLLAPMNLEKNNQDGMLSNGSIPPPPESDENIEVGDYIQWESEGAFQFEEARQVRAIQEYQGADWVFVKGSETGIPMEQVVLDKKGEINGSQANLKPPVFT